MKDFFELSRLLSKPGADIASQLAKNPAVCHWLHMAVGAAGEAGELLDAVKKAADYGKALDRKNVVEEIGDIRFYLAGLMNALNISEEEVFSDTRDKLMQRYSSGGYSDQQAQDRADKITIQEAPKNLILNEDLEFRKEILLEPPPGGLFIEARLIGTYNNDDGKGRIYSFERMSTGAVLHLKDWEFNAYEDNRDAAD